MLNCQKSRLFGFVLLLMTAFSIKAQPVVKDVSPFSRIGLGDFVFQNSITTIGMGGIGAAFSSPVHTNFRNPASLGHLRSATFEVGMFLERSNLNFNEESQKIWNGNLSYLSLAFPLQNSLNEVLERRRSKVKWGMNITLQPYTTVGYAIQTQEINPAVDTTLNTFVGSGGTNKIVWGNGFQYKNFTFGANLGFLFGSIEFDREVNFLSIDNGYNDVFRDDLSVNGFIWDFGAMYQYHFGKEYKSGDTKVPEQTLTIGIYGNPSNSFSTKSTNLRSRVNGTFVGIVDTVAFESGVKGNGKLPAEFTIGLMYRYKSKWLLGLDYSFADWSNYENDGKPETLNESQRVALGVQFTPDATSYNSYLKRISLRTGFYYIDDPRIEDLKQYAITFGLGLPIVLPRQQTSFINLAFELGKYDSDTISENFFKINLGFTLNDNSWFFKRKFN